MHRSDRLPGPKGHYLFGSLPEFRRDVLGFLSRCACDYGDVVGFRLAHIPCCLLADPDLIARVLVRDADRTEKAWDVRKLRHILGHGLLTSEGEPWRRQRRLIQPAFHGERVAAYAGIMVAAAQRALDGWREGEVRDLHADMMQITLDIVAQALFGVDVSAQAEIVGTALAVNMRWFEDNMTAWLPIPWGVPTPKNLRARRAVHRLDRVIADILRQARARGPGDDLLSSLLAARDEDGAAMSDRQLRDEAVTLLLAGHETTAIALSWTLLLLMQHPEIEARLLAELDTVLAGRAPRGADLARLPYTRQVLQESMRLYPPAWGIGRAALAPMELGGYRIPAGTQLLTIPWVTHRDPRFYPEPERFAPERWSPQARREIPKHAYFPFGAGPRVCIGGNFAMMEAMLLLALLMQRFRLERVPGHPVVLQPAVTLRPRYGIRATVRLR